MFCRIEKLLSCSDKSVRRAKRLVPSYLKENQMAFVSPRTLLPVSAASGLSSKQRVSRNGRASSTSVAPVAVLSRDRLSADDAEAKRLDSTDAFKELQKLAQKQSVNRVQDVSSKHLQTIIISV